MSPSLFSLDSGHVTSSSCNGDLFLNIYMRISMHWYTVLITQSSPNRYITQWQCEILVTQDVNGFIRSRTSTAKCPSERDSLLPGHLYRLWLEAILYVCMLFGAGEPWSSRDETSRKKSGRPSLMVASMAWGPIVDQAHVSLMLL